MNRKPEHKISLISLESLREDLPVSLFIEQCRPNLAKNIGSQFSEQLIMVEERKFHHQEFNSVMKVNASVEDIPIGDNAYESEAVRLFGEGDTQFDVTDNEYNQ